MRAAGGDFIPASMARRATADLAILISLWACADRGVESMFGSPGADARPVATPTPKPKKRTRNGRS